MSTKSKKTENTEAPKPPIAKVRVGLISGSIWKRATDNGTFYAATFERRYQDAEGNWHSSHSYDPQSLLALAKAADLAHSRITAEQVQDGR